MAHQRWAITYIIDVEQDGSGRSPETWNLTELGRKLYEGSDPDRLVDVVADFIGNTPEVIADHYDLYKEQYRVEDPYDDDDDEEA